MAQKQDQINYGEAFASWQVPEYEKHKRTKQWYIGAVVLDLLFLLYAFWTANFLFAVIIIVATIVIILFDSREPDMVNISLTDEGVVVGRKFYDYDELKDFVIVYKPRLEVKNLYFEFKASLKHRLSIPLMEMNPLPIRENLLKYLSENLERTDEPLSEGLAKMLKL